mmetsp:Transcript_17929/g.57360  ORF Transcript_17929/g.57360 Transcript_17929/m.57360 type:complete len:220 (+) Transcript_17929:586-1245(+)
MEHERRRCQSGSGRRAVGVRKVEQVANRFLKRRKEHCGSLVKLALGAVEAHERDCPVDRAVLRVAATRSKRIRHPECNSCHHCCHQQRLRYPPPRVPCDATTSEQRQACVHEVEEGPNQSTHSAHRKEDGNLPHAIAMPRLPRGGKVTESEHAGPRELAPGGVGLHARQEDVEDKGRNHGAEEGTPCERQRPKRCTLFEGEQYATHGGPKRSCYTCSGT